MTKAYRTSQPLINMINKTLPLIKDLVTTLNKHDKQDPSPN